MSNFQIGKLNLFSFSLFFIFFTQNDLVLGNKNISCYQCVRHENTECEPHELKPCTSGHDRCVTHIMKDKQDGFKISRECGLGPCSFSDLTGLQGLGLDNCDRSKDEYFCIFCCKEHGCNKNNSHGTKPSCLLALIISLVLAIILINT